MTDTELTVEVGVGPVAPADVVAVARQGARVRLSADAVAAIRRSRAVVDALADDVDPHYGISTGFGALATRHIPAERRAQLQRSLVRSHAATSGLPLEREVVRAMMLLRLSTLATGHTGIRPETAQLLADLLSHDLVPVVREYGSLGCSGDLAPLAHCALALIGEGQVTTADGGPVAAADALAAAGLTPVELDAKEGLALINGTDGMLGMLVLAIADLRRLLVTADITAAMSIEGLLGTDRVFAAELQDIRPHPGQALSAANLTSLMADLLSHGITPVVREYGSLGCSGDLAPLSHCALALMGRATSVTPTARWCRPRTPSRPPDSSRWSWSPRRASRSSTAPTGCWACSSWRSPTCGCCCAPPTSPRR